VGPVSIKVQNTPLIHILSLSQTLSLLARTAAGEGSGRAGRAAWRARARGGDGGSGHGGARSTELERRGEEGEEGAPVLHAGVSSRATRWARPWRGGAAWFHAVRARSRTGRATVGWRQRGERGGDVCGRRGAAACGGGAGEGPWACVLLRCAMAARGIGGRAWAPRGGCRAWRPAKQAGRESSTGARKEGD